ncbi:TolB-like 6-bladed beta-propeller domain-containing protein [Neolewinella aurantiaca]|uniref:BF3164 family lipoprotein n=1 Tax=Neolewinella aurantiaca TaxID=2602767 RepID=UPI00164F97D0
MVFYDGVGKGTFKVFDGSSHQYLFTYPDANNELEQHDFIDDNSIINRNGTLNYLDYPIYRRVKINRQDSTFQRLEQVDLSGMIDNINRLAHLNDTLYTAMNSDTEFNAHQSLLFSSKSSTVLKTFAEYPEEGLVFESPEAKSAQYRYTVVADEARGQIAVFYTYVNLIRFYDFTGALLKEVRVGSYTTPQIPKERNLYFLAPVATDDNIYVLYLNQNNASVNEDPETIRPELQVYNWEGELLKRSYIDAPVYTFDVSVAGDQLIGIAFQEEGAILQASPEL